MSSPESTLKSMVSERSFHLRMTGAATPNVISKTGKIKQSHDQKWSAAAISLIPFHGRGFDKSKPLGRNRFETTLIHPYFGSGTSKVKRYD